MRNKVYRLAAEFRSAAIWKYMYDSELFAVKLPDGSLGYCCVLGNLGKMLALAVYPGDAGLASYRKLGDTREDTDLFRIKERIMSQDCIMCAFDNKEEMEERDLEDIRKSGVKCRAKQSYPLLRRYRPYCVPGFIDDQSDLEILGLALEAGLNIAAKIKANTRNAQFAKMGLGFAEGIPFDRTIPLLEKRSDGDFSWSMVGLPAPSDKQSLTPVLANELQAQMYKKIRKSGAVECELFMCPKPVAHGVANKDGKVSEPEGMPFFPFMMLYVDHADGLVLHCVVTSEPGINAKTTSELTEGLLTCISQYKRPLKLFVRHQRVYALFSGIAEQVGVKLEIKHNLPFVDEAAKDMYQTLEGDDDESNPADEIAKLLNKLEATGGCDAVPNFMVDQLKNLADSEFITAEDKERLLRLIGAKP
ncbi:MAG: hypothetical protein LBK46_02340 [Oscillospiraceae bacterium]|jgi:hypothetical protein|nr:hypothetical protein [Oscillospiraceae bacterium]